jgi:hypothetical protein
MQTDKKSAQRVQEDLENLMNTPVETLIRMIEGGSPDSILRIYLNINERHTTLMKSITKALDKIDNVGHEHLLDIMRNIEGIEYAYEFQGTCLDIRIHNNGLYMMICSRNISHNSRDYRPTGWESKPEHFNYVIKILNMEKYESFDDRKPDPENMFDISRYGYIDFADIGKADADGISEFIKDPYMNIRRFIRYVNESYGFAFPEDSGMRTRIICDLPTIGKSKVTYSISMVMNHAHEADIEILMNKKTGRHKGHTTMAFWTIKIEDMSLFPLDFTKVIAVNNGLIKSDIADPNMKAVMFATKSISNDHKETVFTMAHNKVRIGRGAKLLPFEFDASKDGVQMERYHDAIARFSGSQEEGD